MTRERDGSLALGGSGTPVDWVVEMTRFDQEALFDRARARKLLLGIALTSIAVRGTEQVERLAADWFTRYLRRPATGQQP